MSRSWSSKSWAIWTALAMLTGSVVQGQTLTPYGIEYFVTPPMAGDQVFPALDLNAQGGILVWQDNGIDQVDLGIAARRLDANLNGVGDIFRVPDLSRGDQVRPRVALMADGGLVFTWEGIMKGKKKKPGASESFMRIMDAGGQFLTKDIHLTPELVGEKAKNKFRQLSWKKNKLKEKNWKIKRERYYQRSQTQDPTPVVLDDGSILVTYTGVRRTLTNTFQIVTEVKSKLKKGRVVYTTNDVLRPVTVEKVWKRDVFFQRFTAQGDLLGQEMVVNQMTENVQRQPRVAKLADGRFVVVWISEILVDESPLANSIIELRGRLFSADGTPAGDEFTVNSESAVCARPAVTARADGGFTVVWNQRSEDPSERWDIFGRALDANGDSDAPAFQVNETSFGDQFLPRISNLGQNQLIVWSSMGQDGSKEGVFGRLATFAGVAGPEIQINTTTQGSQVHPVVASDTRNRFLVAWSGFAGSTSFDLQGQQFKATQPLPAPDSPQVVALSSDSLEVSWNAIDSSEIAAYQVFIDGSLAPLEVMQTSLVVEGLEPESSHEFSLAYVLIDGRRSLSSEPSSGSTLPLPAPLVTIPDILGTEPGEGETSVIPSGSIPVIVETVPFRISFAVEDNFLVLTWGTDAGAAYQVEISNNFENWIHYGESRVATGTSDTIRVNPKESAAWFRIRRLP